MAANDPLEICPLDVSHSILKSRMQFHLVKCMKNHNLEDKRICPYNTVHIVDKIHFQSHVATCPDYREVHGFIYQTNDRDFNGIIPMEQVSQIHENIPKGGEDSWDDDIVQPTYDPMKNSEGKPIMRTLIGASKAKRREFRKLERERMAQLTDPTPMPTKPDELDKEKTSVTPLRAPQSTCLPIAKSQPLRPPRNLQTPSTDEYKKKPLLPETKLKPVADDKHDTTAVTQDTKTSEKVKMPKRKPNFNSEEAVQEAKTDAGKLPEKLQMSPQVLQENVTDSTPQSANNSSDKFKKIGRCAAKFA